jgi:hypothetical protein
MYRDLYSLLQARYEANPHLKHVSLYCFASFNSFHQRPHLISIASSPLRQAKYEANPFTGRRTSRKEAARLRKEAARVRAQGR